MLLYCTHTRTHASVHIAYNTLFSRQCATPFVRTAGGRGPAANPYPAWQAYRNQPCCTSAFGFLWSGRECPQKHRNAFVKTQFVFRAKPGALSSLCLHTHRHLQPRKRHMTKYKRKKKEPFSCSHTIFDYHEQPLATPLHPTPTPKRQHKANTRQ